MELPGPIPNPEVNAVALMILDTHRGKLVAANTKSLNLNSYWYFLKSSPDSFCREMILFGKNSQARGYFGLNGKYVRLYLIYDGSIKSSFIK